MEKDMTVVVLILLNAGSAFAMGGVRLVAQVSSSFKILEIGTSLGYETLPAGTLCQATPTPRCRSAVNGGVFLPFHCSLKADFHFKLLRCSQSRQVIPPFPTVIGDEWGHPRGDFLPTLDTYLGWTNFGDPSPLP